MILYGSNGLIGGATLRRRERAGAAGRAVFAENVSEFIAKCGAGESARCLVDGELLNPVSRRAVVSTVNLPYVWLDELRNRKSGGRA